MTGAFLAATGAPSDSTAIICFDSDRIIRRDLDRFFGINVNALRDHDSNRPSARPLKEALSEMGVKWMRYPGGEKSDFIRWSTPPYENPRPTPLRWYADVPGARLGFDTFMSLARSCGAEPFVVVGYDSSARSGLTEDEYLQDAVAWVRYANRDKKCGVRRWEIGNENWHNETAPKEEMARIVRRFAAAMKAVDPTILVGASCKDPSWNDGFLAGASESLDFLTVSQYNGWEWGSYEAFEQDTEPDLLGSVRSASASIEGLVSPKLKGHLRIVVTEMNTKDYSPKGWADSNDLAHALPTFVGLGRMALHPRVDAAMAWNTRWVNDLEARESMFYSLDPKNQLTFTGAALKMWGANVKPILIEAACASPKLAVFAASSVNGKELSLWAVNRSSSPQRATVQEKENRKLEITGWTRLAGTSLKDTLPRTTAGRRIQGLSVTLPPYSITCLSLLAK